MKRKIVFLTGTRADYGKIKPLLQAVEKHEDFELNIFVTGMHMLKQFGETYREVLKDGYRNVFVAYDAFYTDNTSYNLGQVTSQFTGYITQIEPDAIVVHGDRIEALAGAMVGALNNIHVIHIEGGEVSGTIDESIRHAISKFSHTHLVANEEAASRLLQMGEQKKSIFTIGSPDIDVMISDNLPSLSEVKTCYEIPFDEYSILLFHPITTEYDTMSEQAKEVVRAVKESGRNFIVIYPNNDQGSLFILEEYRHELRNYNRCKIYPSIRFERFLTLLKHADCICGNSSAGVREAALYGVPAIDIGTRQRGRYSQSEMGNIQHCDADAQEILSALNHIDKYRKESCLWGQGNSAEAFISVLENEVLWNRSLQKQFRDYGDKP